MGPKKRSSTALRFSSPKSGSASQRGLDRPSAFANAKDCTDTGPCRGSARCDPRRNLTLNRAGAAEPLLIAGGVWEKAVRGVEAR